MLLERSAASHHPLPSSVVKCLWEVFVGGFGMLFLSCVCVCVSVSGVLFSVGVCVCVCVCDMLIFSQELSRLRLSVVAPLPALCSCVVWVVCSAVVCACDLLIFSQELSLVLCCVLCCSCCVFVCVTFWLFHRRRCGFEICVTPLSISVSYSRLVV